MPNSVLRTQYSVLFSQSHTTHLLTYSPLTSPPHGSPLYAQLSTAYSVLSTLFPIPHHSLTHLLTTHLPASWISSAARSTRTFTAFPMSSRGSWTTSRSFATPAKPA